MLYRAFASSLVLLSSAQCFAAAVATVSSKGSVTVSGIQVPTERLMSWPISATDEIVTGEAPATIRFSDGSMLTLQKNSKVKLDASPTKFSLVSGSAILDGRPRTAATPNIRSSANMAAIAQANPATLRYNNSTGALAIPDTATAQYRSPSSQTYYLAPNAVSTGTFNTVSRAVGDVGTTGEIILPNGFKLEVTQTGPTSYTINSILVPVTEPGVSGVQYVSAAPNSLTGATVTFTSPTQQSPNTPVSITITPPGGSTPLTPTQVVTAITTITTTVPPGVPTGTVITPITPATVNTFSPIVP